MKVKEIYEKRYRELLGDEYEDFIKSIERYLPTTIRINTLKISRKEMIERFEENYW